MFKKATDCKICSCAETLGEEGQHFVATLNLSINLYAVFSQGIIEAIVYA
jgi:hypothetical protein